MRDLKDDEYIKDGEIYCSMCNTPRTWTLGDDQLNCKCECLLEQMKIEQKKRDRDKKLQHINRIMQDSSLGEKYRNVSFDDSELMNEHLKAKDYCSRAKDNLKNGTSMFLYGSTGTGKTHTMACMLNSLADNLYTVYFTRFNDIMREYNAAASFSSRKSQDDVLYFYINTIAFLFIDDFGTEFLRESDTRMQSLIYDIINGRYNNTRPIIISSNHTFKELVSDIGYDGRSIWRINELCKDNIIKFAGKNWRAE